jgi:glutathione synthase/RimK-type ligase-like ATP-grasp enzyme
MKQPHIGVATCAAAPDLDEDGPLLLSSLAAAGAQVRVDVWDDDDVAWGSRDIVLARSTWDYPLRRAAFLEWTRRCRQTANPRDVLAWNTDKRYLDDLAAAGVPTVPTIFVEPGGLVPPAATEWQEQVVKPAISGSAADTGRFAGLHDPGAVALMAELHRQNRTVMVQPYLDGIDVDGEISLVFLGGQYSHAVRRAPLLLDRGVRSPVVVADVLSTVERARPSEGEFAVAAAALAAVPGGEARLTYARIDVIPGPDGPLLLELEATDCFLFLSFAALQARDRLSRHLLRSISPAEG